MIWIVVPGFNVERTVGPIIEGCRKYTENVLFVIDGPKDKSAEVAEKAGAETLIFPENHGKGWSLRRGFKYALDKGADKIICIDADGEYDPKFIPDFIEALDEADIVSGSRFKDAYATTKINILGNFALTVMTNALTHGIFLNRWVWDTQTGYRGFNRDALKRILPDMKADRFQIEGETVFEAGRKGIRIKEIPIKQIYNRVGITVNDGFDNAKFLLKKRFGLI